MVTVSILSDNRGADGTYSGLLKAEHGLSIFIDTGKTRILCDMGASSLYAENAGNMGINLCDMDFAFISHAHNDHTGGLEHFLENFTAPVLLSPDVFTAKCFSSRRGSRRDISADHSLADRFPERFRFISESREIAEDIFIIKPQEYGYPKPVGNSWIEGDFNHELALAIKTAKGLIIISSCSHNGALNIMETCCFHTGESRIIAFIGGLHFVDGPESSSETKDFLQSLSQLHPEIAILTGHCTGEEACTLLSTPSVSIFRTGSTFQL